MRQRLLDSDLNTRLVHGGELYLGEDRLARRRGATMYALYRDDDPYRPRRGAVQWEGPDRDEE